MHIMHKDNLRQRTRENMQNLSKKFCVSASQRITAWVLKSKIFAESQNIACYIPINNEVDTWLIISTIWLQGKNCYLPVFTPKTQDYLQFIKFNKYDKLITSKYKIPEPKVVLEKSITPQNLDLSIIPLIGFNSNLFRLGQGAGCYDRAFDFKKQNKEIKPYLLGIGYEHQHVEFRQNSWDMVMDSVITEQAIY